MMSSSLFALQYPAVFRRFQPPHWLTRCVSVMLLFGCGIFLAACSSAADPTFKVLGANVREQTEHGFVLEILIEGDNNNAKPLPLRDVTYTVEVEGFNTFSGTRYPEVILRRYGRQEFVLPASFERKSDQTLSEQTTFSISGSVMYLAPGALSETLFDQSIIKPTAEINGTGTIRLVP